MKFAARRPPAPIILAIEILEGARCTSLLDLVFGIFSEGYRTVLGELPSSKMAPKRLLEAQEAFQSIPENRREARPTCVVVVASSL